MIGVWNIELRRSRSGHANHEKTRLTQGSKGENQKHFIEQQNETQKGKNEETKS
jgi:hypothetical protein